MSLKQAIERRVREKFHPSHLEIQDESSKHQKGGIETHLTLVIVTDEFSGIKRLKRHQTVNQMLADLYENGLYSLRILTYTEREWKGRGETASKPPQCRSTTNL